MVFLEAIMFTVINLMEAIMVFLRVLNLFMHSKRQFEKQKIEIYFMKKLKKSNNGHI